LQQKDDKRIKFFKFKDEDGVLKDHYWFQDMDFMIVLKPISSDVQIVTAFCVDKTEKDKYKNRYLEYRKGIK